MLRLRGENYAHLERLQTTYRARETALSFFPQMSVDISIPESFVACRLFSIITTKTTSTPVNLFEKVNLLGLGHRP